MHLPGICAEQNFIFLKNTSEIVRRPLLCLGCLWPVTISHFSPFL